MQQGNPQQRASPLFLLPHSSSLLQRLHPSLQRYRMLYVASAQPPTVQLNALKARFLAADREQLIVK